METTFISIHDLTPEAHILYSSDSVIDILGYTPDEIVNRSAWNFFSKDELPYAQEFHRKRVVMDTAAVLAYCKVLAKNGEWITCECCFTIVYDVMIVCTSIYQQGGKSDGRALAAPIVRRIFSSSPKDPRYHMLSHISSKFSKPVKPVEHEPRAALFLNRFTRTLTIMYATSALEEVIGIPAHVMRGRSFYYCIAENCLQDSINCLENAKGNDSIAYLRFWFRDPRADDPAPAPDNDSDDEMTTEMSEDTSEGGVQLQSQGASSSSRSYVSAATDSAVESSDSMDIDQMGGAAENPISRNSSGDSGNENETHEAIFGESRESRSSASSLGSSPGTPRSTPHRATNDPIELEAVISCASDGLVVCLRKARPMAPRPTQRPSQSTNSNGVFAAPWATQPILPPIEAGPRVGGLTPGFAPSLGPSAARHDSASPPRAQQGPDSHDFMSVIREQAVFAWALTGINGSLADHAKGKPHGRSTPADGFSVWANDHAEQTGSTEIHHDNGRSHGDERRAASQMFGDPGLGRNGNGGNGNGSSFMR